MTRIFVDFNNSVADERGEKVFVGMKGSWQIERFPLKAHLQSGKSITLSDGELQVEADLEFDEETKSWYGRPNWRTRRDLGSRVDGLEDYRDRPPAEKLVILRYETDVLIKEIQGIGELLASIDEGSVMGLPADFRQWVAILSKASEDLEGTIDALTADGSDKA